MTGKSSMRGWWVMPKECHTTGSCPLTKRSCTARSALVSWACTLPDTGSWGWARANLSLGQDLIARPDVGLHSKEGCSGAHELDCACTAWRAPAVALLHTPCATWDAGRQAEP